MKLLKEIFMCDIRELTIIENLIGAIPLIIILIGLCILLMGCNIEANRCYGDCYNESVTCDHNDNNCIGGSHDCYDSCYGGASGRGLKGTWW